MGIIRAIAEFLQSVFNKGSPSVQKRLAARRLRQAAEALTPALYADGSLLPNFAEAIRQLYLNATPLANLFIDTVSGTDIPRRMRFEAQLVYTGFSEDTQRLLQSLSFDERKKDVTQSEDSINVVFDRQRETLDSVIKAMNGPSFKRMDRDMNMLHHFADLCKMNFVTMMQVFDPNLSSAASGYVPAFGSAPLSTLGGAVEDLYYQTATLSINMSVANATIALATLRAGGDLDSGEAASLLGNVKKISYILTHILTPQNLLVLIRLAREDEKYEPRTIEYNESARQNLVTRLETAFKADQTRIKQELKDERVQDEIQQLFNSEAAAGTTLVPVTGYNAELDDKLHANSALSLSYVTPIQILKSFLMGYFTSPIKTLLNGIVIEGFFNNPAYKSSFSANVYSACEVHDKFAAFEAMFQREARFDTMKIEGYINDSRKDKVFYQNLESIIINVNNEAKKILQESINSLHALYGNIGEILSDMKRSNSELIQNLTVLMVSTRNRDSTEQMDKQFPQWKIFFEVMRNYSIISSREVQK